MAVSLRVSANHRAASKYQFRIPSKREDDIFFVRPQRFERVDCAINMTDPEYGCQSDANEPVNEPDTPENFDQVLVHGAQYIIRNVKFSDHLFIAVNNMEVDTTTGDTKNLENDHIWTLYEDSETNTWFITSQGNERGNSRLYGTPHETGRADSGWSIKKDQQWILSPMTDTSGKTRFTIRNFEYTDYAYRLKLERGSYRTVFDTERHQESSHWYFEPAFEISEEPEWEEIFFFENQGETASVVEAKLNYGIRTSDEFESITETSQTIKASVQAQMTGFRGINSLAQGDPDNFASADVEASMAFAHIYA